jgi:hypothetical protein
VSSGFAYPEHLGSAYRANALGSWLAVLHGNGLSVFHLPLGSAFHAVSLHSVILLFIYYEQYRISLYVVNSVQVHPGFTH